MKEYEILPLEEMECFICDKVEKVSYSDELTLPYLCRKHYLEEIEKSRGEFKRK